MYATIGYPHTDLPDDLDRRVNANQVLGHVTLNLDLLYLSMPPAEASRLAIALIEQAADLGDDDAMRIVVTLEEDEERAREQVVQDEMLA